jgi:hypothetical protein
MCGIAGYISKTDGPFQKSVIEQLLLDIQPRGRDAVGMAWLEGTRFKVGKSPGLVPAYLAMPEYYENEDKVAASRLVLLHTRAASHGDPSNNKNNHPLYNDKGIIIHNGIVTPPKWLKKAQGQTDSEQLMMYLQKQGFKAINVMRGWLAIAYFDFATRSLYLYNHDAPLYMVQTADSLVWSSYPDSLKKMGIGEVVSVPKDTLYRINDIDMKLEVVGTYAPKSYTVTQVTRIIATAPTSAIDGATQHSISNPVQPYRKPGKHQRRYGRNGPVTSSFLPVSPGDQRYVPPSDPTHTNWQHRLWEQNRYEMNRDVPPWRKAELDALRADTAPLREPEDQKQVREDWWNDDNFPY